MTVGSRLAHTPLMGATQAAMIPLTGPLVAGRRWRSVVAVGDMFAAVALVLCIPFVILAIGIPIALCVRLLLWLGGLL